MGVVNKFLLLLWKNFVIQKRKKIITILEIGIPTIFALILIFVRLRVNGTEQPNGKSWGTCHFQYLDSRLPKKVVFAPRNNATIQLLQRTHHHTDFKFAHGFDTEDEMVDFLLYVNGTVNNTRDYLGGVVFTNKFPDGGSSLPKNIDYKLRLSSAPRMAHNGYSINPFKQDTRWNTEFMFPLFQRIGPRDNNSVCGGSPGYQREGFLALQYTINMAIYDVMNKDHGKLDVFLRRHPYPPYNDDFFVLVIQQQFPLVLMLSFVLVALNIVKDVVYEKERKLKESMKMMGLSNWLHWTAWYIKYFLFLLITVIIMTIFICVKTYKGPVIGLTSPTIVFVFLMLYAMATISFCFALSVFFKKANSGAAAGGILFFISYIPYFFLQPRYATFSWGEKIAACLVSNIAMAYGSQVIGMFEGTGTGVQWSNFEKGVSVDDNFAMLHVMVMLLIDTFLYGLITWYVETVFPGEFGVPAPWYFMFTRRYWFGTKANEDIPDSKKICIGQDPQYFEQDPQGIRAGIRIRNLKKVFGNNDNKKVAVAGMSLDMYEGQITALLGHNGAGKTTTMSMLTGFIPVTGGTAYVNGYDIRKDIASVRSSLGLCPQHDILFDTLTVTEHLRFFAKLKGCPSNQVSQEVETILADIRLEHKRHAQSKTLSGGMKRRLSVGIALIAGSKIVILDEPSSGLDPDARRQIWTVLQKNRAGRTMLLTTHFMDEADLLGDRIAIMADGVVKCCGSSMFLKNKYGAGYHMVIVKDHDCKVGAVTDMVKTYVPEAEIESNIGAELSFILPHERSDKFEELFTEIEKNLKDLGIVSYGASVTTMEEVFLRVGENKELLKEKIQRSGANSVPPQTGVSLDLSLSSSCIDEPLVLDSDVEYSDGVYLVLQQFYGMLIKRAVHTLRNKLVTSVQLVVPLFFTVMALIVLKTFPGPHDSPPLNLNVNDFGANTIVYSEPLNRTVEFDRMGRSYASLFNDPDDQVIFVNNQQGYTKNPNISQYLFDAGKKSLGDYNLHYMVGASIDRSTDRAVLNTTAYFNDQAFHSSAISLVALCSAILRYFMNSTEYSISTVNHPLPRTSENKVHDQMTQGTTGFTIAFNVVFGMSFLASSFVLFLIKERATKAKHIQFVSGVHAINFWLSTFCWDIINYLLPVVCLLISFWAFDIEAYIEGNHIGHIFFLFFMYGYAMLPFMYLMSFIFTVPSTGYVWLTMFNILAGVATLLAVGILSIPQLGLTDLSHVLEWVFLTILPNYCLSQGLSDYYSNHEFLGICPKITMICPFAPNPCCGVTTGNCGPTGCIYYNENYLSWKQGGIGRMLAFLAIQGTTYFLILLFFESGLAMHLLYKIYGVINCSPSVDDSSRASSLSSDDERTPLLTQRQTSVSSQQYLSSLVQEDTDVATERARLANTHIQELHNQDAVILKELTKYYDKNLAVDHMSVGIPQGECFGLLGVNGAGKTTTFKMLTGDVIMSSGEAFLDGYSIKEDITKVRRQLGYCPQYDALIDQLTGRETLYMFARLRGVRKSKIADVVNNLLNGLLLKPHADKLVKAYSGGNKRKLSTGIALVGNPRVVFLDEPTTGMDPVARRYLWDTLSRVRDSGRTLILTSHSMEECEALCTRLAIMVNGQFKCLGSTQHLKSKFGEGYTIQARISYTSDGLPPDMQPLMTYIETSFPGSELKDIHQGMVNYHINNTDVTLAQLFGKMEKAKSQFNFEDYSVSQTTLDQVFINFARAQIPPQEERPGCCDRCRVICLPICCCC